MDACRFGNPRYGRLGGLRYAKQVPSALWWHSPLQKPFAGHAGFRPYKGVTLSTQRETNDGLSLIQPRVRPVLDPHFRPATLAHRAFRQATLQKPAAVTLALERADQSVSVFKTLMADSKLPKTRGNFRYLKHLL